MSTPRQYIDSIKNHLIDNLWVTEYQILMERATDDSVLVRARVHLTDDSILYFSEYRELDEDGVLHTMTYGYHWMTASGDLVRRWDNAPHYPHLPGFPDHVHEGDERNILPGEPMNLFTILDAIAATKNSPHDEPGDIR